MLVCSLDLKGELTLPAAIDQSLSFHYKVNTQWQLSFLLPKEFQTSSSRSLYYGPHHLWIASPASNTTDLHKAKAELGKASSILNFTFSFSFHSKLEGKWKLIRSHSHQISLCAYLPFSSLWSWLRLIVY